MHILAVCIHESGHESQNIIGFDIICTIIAYMFGSDDMPYKKYFKSNVFIFSPTAKLGSMNLPHVKESNLHDSFDISFLKTLWEEQDALCTKYGRAKAVPILLIFDDVVSDLSKEQKKCLKKLWMQHLFVNPHLGCPWKFLS